MESLSRDKHSSILQTLENYEHKKFHDIVPRWLSKRDMEKVGLKNDIDPDAVFKLLLEASSGRKPSKSILAQFKTLHCQEQML